MTYNVFSGTLNPTQSINVGQRAIKCDPKINWLTVVSDMLAMESRHKGSNSPSVTVQW